MSLQNYDSGIKQTVMSFMRFMNNVYYPGTTHFLQLFFGMLWARTHTHTHTSVLCYYCFWLLCCKHRWITEWAYWHKASGLRGQGSLCMKWLLILLVRKSQGLFKRCIMSKKDKKQPKQILSVCQSRGPTLEGWGSSTVLCPLFLCLIISPWLSGHKGWCEGMRAAC